MTEDTISSDKSQAVITYFGHGSFPNDDPSAVLAAFGPVTGADLKTYVEALKSELFDVDVDWTAHTLQSGTDMAISRLRIAHPELSDEAIEALGWRFSYSWK